MMALSSIKSYYETFHIYTLSHTLESLHSDTYSGVHHVRLLPVRLQPHRDGRDLLQLHRKLNKAERLSNNRLKSD